MLSIRWEREEKQKKVLEVMKQEDINTFTVIKSDENHYVIIDECSEILGYRYYIVNCSEYLKKWLWVIKRIIEHMRNYYMRQEL
jgi:hypothetical protein